MKCDSCGGDIERQWRFCPRCGARPSRGFFNFGDIFSRMKKEMEGMDRGMDRGFEQDIEAFDLSPFFRKPLKTQGSGFTIKIVSGTGMHPKVEVQTFGNVDQEKIQKQLQEQLGYRPQVREKPIPAQTQQRLKLPPVTEEPATEVRRVGSAVVVDMEIPGVASEKDIEITELESSVEVKAVAGDRAYFKILTKPEQFHIAQKKFEKGRLHLEFA